MSYTDISTIFNANSVISLQWVFYTDNLGKQSAKILDPQNILPETTYNTTSDPELYIACSVLKTLLIGFNKQQEQIENLTKKIEMLEQKLLVKPQ